jgi:hypothetical protein
MYSFMEPGAVFASVNIPAEPEQKVKPPQYTTEKPAVSSADVKK